MGRAQDYTGLLANIRSLSYATVDEKGEAQVRIIDTLLHNGKLYFVTARGKDFYRQVVKNGRAGVVGLTKDWKMVRLSASVKKTGREMVDLIFEKDPGIKDLYPGDSRRIMEAFCLESGQGEVFDLAGVPIRRESFSFGGEWIKEKGFVITQDCTACGACAQSCPQQCIEEGVPYEITQQNCLHCGLCGELCPAAAIKAL